MNRSDAYFFILLLLENLNAKKKCNICNQVFHVVIVSKYYIFKPSLRYFF